MINEGGVVRYVVNNSPTAPEADGLVAMEVEPGFDGTNRRWNGSHFIEVEGAIDNDAAMFIRARRNRLLTACDWTQGKDATARITKPQQAAWAAYRQALCDLTDQPGFPHDVQWPARPA